MALVSVSIAILNLLPIPVLDGGQITILLIESAMRRDLSLRIKEAVNLVGLALVMLLMAAVIVFDLSRNLHFGAAEAPAPPPTDQTAPPPEAPGAERTAPATPAPQQPVPQSP